MSWILLLKSKDEFFNIFKFWLPRTEAYGSRLDCLQIDGREEFISIVLQNFCQEQGIKIGFTAPYMHEESGIAEQCQKTLAKMKDLLFINNKLPTQFWAKAMDIANYLRNRLPTKCIAGKTVIIPEEAQIEVRQNLKYIHIFGNRISTHILSEKPSKSDVYKTWNGIFIGYTDTTKHQRVWALKTHQVVMP